MRYGQSNFSNEYLASKKKLFFSSVYIDFSSISSITIPKFYTDETINSLKYNYLVVIHNDFNRT